MRFFEKFVLSILKSKSKKTLVILLTILALIGSIMMLPTKMVLAKMLPGKSANTYSIYVDTPSGSALNQTKEVTNCVVDILKAENEVTDIEVFLGQGAPLDYAGLVKGSSMKAQRNLAEIVVNLTNKHERDEESFLMIQRLRPIIKQKCETLVEGTNIKMIEQPAGPPTLASIVVEVHGEDYEKIMDISNEVADILKGTEGLVDIDIMADESYKKYELIPNKEKIIKSALSIEQLNNILYLAFEGMSVAAKNSKNSPDQIPIFLVLSKDTKKIDANNLAALRSKLSSLKLMNQKGMMVPLTEVVDIKEVSSNPTIMHKDLNRMVNVIAETDMVSQVYPLLDAREKMIELFSKKYEVKKEPGMSTYLVDLHLIDKETGVSFSRRCV